MGITFHSLCDEVRRKRTLYFTHHAGKVFLRGKNLVHVREVKEIGEGQAAEGDKEGRQTQEESVPLEVNTRQVNVELLPPPCSACSIRQISSSFASSSVYFRFARMERRIVSAVESSFLSG